MKSIVHEEIAEQVKPMASPRIIAQDLDQVLSQPTFPTQDKQADHGSNPTHQYEVVNPPKMRVNKRSKFYGKGGRTPKVRPFISPLSEEYVAGCNDDLLSTTSTLTVDDNTEARERQQATRNWMSQQRKNTQQVMSQVCTTEHKLKRLPLPSTIQCNGTLGEALEKFIGKNKGHIAQQDNFRIYFTS